MAWDTTSQTTGTATTAANATGADQATGTTGAAQTYGAPQQALQGQMPGLYQNLMQGNIPSTFTAPQPVIDNFNKQFNTWTAPQIAASGGANSPMLAANHEMGMSNLLSNLYQQGVGNYNNALAGGENAAFASTGQTGQSANTGTSTAANNTNSQFNNSTQNQYDAMQNILNLFGQVFR